MIQPLVDGAKLLLESVILDPLHHPEPSGWWSGSMLVPHPSSCSSGAAAGDVLLPLAPAAAPPEQLLGLALIPDPYSEQVPGSA